MTRKSLVQATLLVALLAPSTVFATNGMNLEGYGAKSHALGGASMAFDTGNSAVMNNPATLGMMKDGQEELGFSIRGLHPAVSAVHTPLSDASDGDAYYMPSLSYMRKDGNIAWGVAVLAQGGMGTEYGNDSPLFQGGYSMQNTLVSMSGKEIRSELGGGRLMFPIAWNITPNTTIGASFDLIWTSMDLQMDLDGAHFRKMTMGQGGSVSGSMYNMLGGMIGSSVTDINYARFDFSNNSSFIGEAIGYGTGAKIGMTHRFSKVLSIGGSYHTRSLITDLETSKATLSFAGTGSAFSSPNPNSIAVTGTIKVKDFEWPSILAAGFALYPDERWMIVGDVKYMDWSTAMKNFSMSFVADNNAPFAGQMLDVEMQQEWKDQTIFSIGAQYKATGRLALRAGASFSTNPVPDSYLNPLFPAITKTHYTGGFGYRITDKSTIAAALAFVPKITATNADDLVISHSQMNWSLNYTHAL
jgi:long-chain fatty acid transport protein